MSTRRTTSSNTPSRAAVRPRSTGSVPSSYFSAFTSPLSGSRSGPTGTSRTTSGSRGFTTTERGNAGSAYKRSPRPNFFSRMWAKINKLIRDFVRYAQKHPFQVVVPLIMAIMGGGALVGLVKRMGGLEGMGLGGLQNIGLDKLIGVGHGVRTGIFEGFMGGGGGGGGLDGSMGEGQQGGMSGFGMMKGAVKVASAFL